MKKIYFLWIIILVISAACNKKVSDNTPSGMKYLKVGSSFTWNTASNIQFRLHNIPSGVLRISSGDESKLYLKAFFADNTVDYTVSVTIPEYEKTVMINSIEVPLDLPFTEFSFPNTKSVSVNYSMSFNGTTDWIKIPNSATLSFPNKYSFEAWVKPTRQQSVKIVQKGDWDGCGLGQDLYHGFLASVYMGNFNTSVISWGGGQPALNTWYHLAGVYDGTTLYLYVNGVLRNSTPVISPLVNNARTISIGSDNGGQKFFQGLIDEVSIWNTALTAQQVNSSMSVPWSGSETGIKGLWHFNEGSGLSVFDATSSHYNGTVYGALFNTDVGYAISSDSDGDGVPNSYDDYPNDASRAYNNMFPSSGSGSLAFEDLWPNQGDYDFNDLVVNYTFNTFTNAQNKPTIIVTDNDFKAFNSPGGMINTIPGNPYINPDTIRITIMVSPNTYTLTDLDIGSFNPFIILNEERGKEVHLPDNTPTALANPAYLGTGDDSSIPSQGRYYKTSNNLPWAISIYENFDYAKESADILSAYLNLAQWATSNGFSYPDWYFNLPGYRNTSNIYQH